MRFASALCLLAAAGAACTYDFDQYGPDPGGQGGGGSTSTTTAPSSSASSGGGGGGMAGRGPCLVVGKTEPLRADFSSSLDGDWTIVGSAGTDSGALALNLQGDVEESSAAHAAEFVLDECWVEVKVVSTGPELGLVELFDGARALRVMIRPYPGVPDTLVLVDDASPLGSTTQVLVGQRLRIEAVGSKVRLSLGDAGAFEPVLVAARPAWLDAPVRLRLGHRRQSEFDGSVTVYFDDVNPP